MTIQKAGPADVPAIAALEAACIPEPWPEDMIGRLRENFIVARDKDTVTGYLALSAVLDEGNIDNIAVSPAYRRRGVADALVSYAVERAREDGLATLMLEVRETNEPALRLYAKHGFEAVGRRKHYYTKPREDAILMTLVL